MLVSLCRMTIRGWRVAQTLVKRYPVDCARFTIMASPSTMTASSNRLPPGEYLSRYQVIRQFVGIGRDPDHHLRQFPQRGLGKKWSAKPQCRQLLRFVATFHQQAVSPRCAAASGSGSPFLPAQASTIADHMHLQAICISGASQKLSASIANALRQNKHRVRFSDGLPLQTRQRESAINPRHRLIAGQYRRRRNRLRFHHASS